MIARAGPARVVAPVALALLLVAAPARATNCAVSPESLSFGVYDVFSNSASDTAATITVACDAETAFEIALGSGAGTVAARTMAAGTDTMAYNLYIDPQRTRVWGEGSGASDTVSAVAAQGYFTVYARAPAGQNLRPGIYVDVVSVTVTY